MIDGIKEVPEIPAGYRTLDSVGRLSRTGKAVLCDYFAWSLWLPVKSVRTALVDVGMPRKRRVYAVPGAIIENAKSYQQAN